MKRFFSAFICVIFAICLSFTMIACDDGKDTTNGTDGSTPSVSDGNGSADDDTKDNDTTDDGSTDNDTTDDGDNEEKVPSRPLTKDEFDKIAEATTAYTENYSKYLRIDYTVTDEEGTETVKAEFYGKISVHGNDGTDVYFVSDDPRVRYEKLPSGEWRYYKADRDVIRNETTRSDYGMSFLITVQIMYPFFAPGDDGIYKIEDKYVARDAEPFFGVLGEYYKDDADMLAAVGEYEGADFSTFGFGIADGKISYCSANSGIAGFIAHITYDETKTLSVPPTDECTIMYGTSFALPLDVRINTPYEIKQNTYFRFVAPEDGIYKTETSVPNISFGDCRIYFAEPYAPDMQISTFDDLSEISFKSVRGDTYYFAYTASEPFTFEISDPADGNTPFTPLTELGTASSETDLSAQDGAVYYAFNPNTAGSWRISGINADVEIFSVSYTPDSAKAATYAYNSICYYQEDSRTTVPCETNDIITTYDDSSLMYRRYIVRVSNIQNGAKLIINSEPNA